MTAPLALLVNIDVDDVERAVSFYSATFGLSVGRRLGASGVEMLGASSPLYLLVKAAGTRASPATPDVRTYERHWTPVHLDFVVEEIEPVVERAVLAGAKVEVPIADHDWGRIAMLADPFGHGFCVIRFLGRGYDEIASRGPESLQPKETAMTVVHLDHLMVPSRDKLASAKRLADLLGVPWSAAGVGPFVPVYVNDGLTLDFDQWADPIPMIHYCFRVAEDEFDAILGRIKAAGIPYRSRVRGPVDCAIDTAHGGRIVYWNEPDGHQWEMLTVSYARRTGP